jgi:hypothetical protein
MRFIILVQLLSYHYLEVMLTQYLWIGVVNKEKILQFLEDSHAYLASNHQNTDVSNCGIEISFQYTLSKGRNEESLYCFTFLGCPRHIVFKLLYEVAVEKFILLLTLSRCESFHQPWILFDVALSMTQAQASLQSIVNRSQWTNYTI